MVRAIITICATCLFLVAGCGGDEGPDIYSPDNPNKTGYFIDTGVEGIAYSTPTKSGLTLIGGAYSYTVGETVQFSIGAIQFPEVVAQPYVTPVYLAENLVNKESAVTNMARLIQSLSVLGPLPPELVGIPETFEFFVIPEGAMNAAVAPINFDVSIQDFENNPDVINLVANSGGRFTELVSADDAMEHLNATLASLPESNGNDESGIKSDLNGPTASFAGLWLKSADENSHETYFDIFSDQSGIAYVQSASNPSCYIAEEREIRKNPNGTFTIRFKETSLPSIEVNIMRSGDELRFVNVSGGGTTIWMLENTILANEIIQC